MLFTFLSLFTRFIKSYCLINPFLLLYIQCNLRMPFTIGAVVSLFRIQYRYKSRVIWSRVKQNSWDWEFKRTFPTLAGSFYFVQLAQHVIIWVNLMLHIAIDIFKFKWPLSPQPLSMNRVTIYSIQVNWFLKPRISSLENTMLSQCKHKIKLTIIWPQEHLIEIVSGNNRIIKEQDERWLQSRRWQLIDRKCGLNQRYHQNTRWVCQLQSVNSLHIHLLLWDNEWFLPIFVESTTQI